MIQCLMPWQILFKTFYFSSFFGRRKAMLLFNLVQTFATLSTPYSYYQLILSFSYSQLVQNTLALTMQYICNQTEKQMFTLCVSLCVSAIKRTVVLLININNFCSCSKWSLLKENQTFHLLQGKHRGGEEEGWAVGGRRRRRRLHVGRARMEK